MALQHILFSVEDGIARLTLNRPDKLNSFTEAMHAEVRDVLDQIQNDSSVRVLVMTGAGRGFCAGQDLADPCIDRKSTRLNSSHVSESRMASSA